MEKKGVIGRKGLTLRDNKEKRRAKKLLSARCLGRCAVGVRANTFFTCKGQKVALLVSAYVAWIGIPRRGFFYNHLNATSKIKDVQPGGTRLFAVDGVQI